MTKKRTTPTNMDKRRKDDVTNAIDDETKRPLALKYDHFTCKVNAGIIYFSLFISNWDSSDFDSTTVFSTDVNIFSVLYRAGQTVF